MDDYRGEEIKKNKFRIKTDYAIRSLKEVEIFLHNLRKVRKGINLYKFFK